MLGPILFTLYMLPLGHIIRQFGAIRYNLYADDIQLYVSFNPEETNKVSVLLKCLSSIKDWMANNFLQLNEDKTEVLIVAPDTTASKVVQLLGSLSSAVQSKLRNLGVIFDHNMLLDQHIKSLTCFFQLRNIAKLRAVGSLLR